MKAYFWHLHIVLNGVLIVPLIPCWYLGLADSKCIWSWLWLVLNHFDRVVLLFSKSTRRRRPVHSYSQNSRRTYQLAESELSRSRTCYGSWWKRKTEKAHSEKTSVNSLLQNRGGKRATEILRKGKYNMWRLKLLTSIISVSKRTAYPNSKLPEPPWRHGTFHPSDPFHKVGSYFWRSSQPGNNDPRRWKQWDTVAVPEALEGWFERLGTILFGIERADGAEPARLKKWKFGFDGWSFRTQKRWRFFK